MEQSAIQRDRLDRLAAKMKKGDRAAAGALYDELAAKVYGFIYARTGKRESAEDLSQEIFLKLIDRIGEFDGEKGRFVSWFWRMARNTLIDHYRRRDAVPFSQFGDEEVAGMAVTEMPDADIALSSRRLHAVVGTFTPDERELFELRFVAELSYKDIAEVMERPEGTLRVAALRLKEKIRKEFKKR